MNVAGFFVTTKDQEAKIIVKECKIYDLLILTSIPARLQNVR